MKNSLWFLSILCSAAILIALPCAASEATIVMLTQEEIDTIRDYHEPLTYLDPELCTFIHHFFREIKDQKSEELSSAHALHNLINDQKTMIPHALVKTALQELFDYLVTTQAAITQEHKESLLKTLKKYHAALEEGLFDLIIDDDMQDSTITRKRFRTLHARDLFTNSLISNSATFNGSVLINNSESISDGLVVLETLHVVSESDFNDFVDIIGSPEQGCIIFVDANMVEKARICSSPTAGDKGVFVSVDGGTTQNYRINNTGGTIVAASSSGVALSVTGNSGASAITATGNGTTTAPALVLLNVPAGSVTDSFLTIDSFGIVKQSASGTNAIINGCQTGPVTIGTEDATSLTLATNACATRLVIDQNGAVTIAQPTSGAALTVNGNIVIPQANSAKTEGIFMLGGTTAATDINLYEFGSGNFFAGNGTVNTTVTGINNIDIGTSANSSLTTANNTTAIGPNSQAASSDTIAIGNSANGSAQLTIALGSTDSTSSGAAPTASNINAIALGSASGANAGASASALAAIAIGGANGSTFTGATASGSSAIAFGLNAVANSSTALALGSASGTAGGTAPAASSAAAIALGSANGTLKGAVSGNISSIAIGGADGTSAGASALGSRSIALGLNANTASGALGGIALGSASSTGSLAPVASGTTAIAIGSASGAERGTLSSTAASVAIGGSDGVSTGASSTGSPSVVIGVGATTSQANAIILGNTTATAVAVGIGTSTPAAKLHVVGSDGTPVIRLNQVNTGSSNAPHWLNPSTSAVVGTAINYNSSNQLFGVGSSKRYKTNIRPLESQSEILYQLNPVIYDSKNDAGKNIAGFIAEEVYSTAPDLAILNNEGQPENVAYNSLHALVIKELQKHQQQLNQNAQNINEQQTKVNLLLLTTKKLQEKAKRYIKK